MSTLVTAQPRQPRGAGRRPRGRRDSAPAATATTDQRSALHREYRRVGATSTADRAALVAAILRRPTGTLTAVDAARVLDRLAQLDQAGAAQLLADPVRVLARRGAGQAGGAA